MIGQAHMYNKYRLFSWHGDVIQWNHFPRYWPFVWGIHRSRVNSTHKSQWRGSSMFSFICAWINDWVNNREAGDLWRHRAHYDVIVMDTEVKLCPALVHFEIFAVFIDLHHMNMNIYGKIRFLLSFRGIENALQRGRRSWMWHRVVPNVEILLVSAAIKINYLWKKQISVTLLWQFPLWPLCIKSEQI